MDIYCQVESAEIDLRATVVSISSEAPRLALTRATIIERH